MPSDVLLIATLICSSSLARFGFIVMDGNGALFGTLQGNTRDVLHKFTVDLPKKHGRGGQSALRFARLRYVVTHANHSQGKGSKSTSTSAKISY